MSAATQVREIVEKPGKNGEEHHMEFHGEHAAKASAAKAKDFGEAGLAEETSTPPAKSARRPWVWALMGAAGVAAIAAGTAYYVHGLSFESTDDAFIEGHIVPVSSRVPGHVAKVYVTDNQWVEKGTLLAELDPADFQTRLAAAEAALQASRAASNARALAVEAAQAGLAEAKASLKASLAQRERAEAKLKRVEPLVPERAVSQDSLDEVTAAVRVTSADVAAKQGKINAQEANIEQATAAARAAESGVRQAEAEVNQFKLNVSYTRICAPISGHVTRKSVETGAFIQVGQPLMALVDPDVWVVANFKETQLAKMRPGQPVVVIADTHPDVKLAAHVDSVQRGSGARFSLLPPENATGNYVKVVQRVPVKIVFDDPEQIERYGLGPGMSVVPIVKIDEPGKSVPTGTAFIKR